MVKSAVERGNVATILWKWRVQAFLDFRRFDFRDFWFTAAYNYILVSSPLVLLSSLDLRGFCFSGFFWCPQINRVNRGMTVYCIKMYRQLKMSASLEIETSAPGSNIYGATTLSGCYVGYGNSANYSKHWPEFCLKQ